MKAISNRWTHYGDHFYKTLRTLQKKCLKYVIKKLYQFGKKHLSKPHCNELEAEGVEAICGFIGRRTQGKQCSAREGL